MNRRLRCRAISIGISTFYCATQRKSRRKVERMPRDRYITVQIIRTVAVVAIESCLEHNRFLRICVPVKIQLEKRQIECHGASARSSSVDFFRSIPSPNIDIVVVKKFSPCLVIHSPPRNIPIKIKTLVSCRNLTQLPIERTYFGPFVSSSDMHVNHIGSREKTEIV